MISKELLSEVLNIHIGLIALKPILENNKTDIGYLLKGSQNTVHEVHNNHKLINIYELAHKCKEWAVKNNRENKDNIDEHFYINDICSQFIGYVEKWQCIVGYRGNKDMRFGTEYETHWSDMNIIFEADTEPEAIFKACEWILKDKR